MWTTFTALLLTIFSISVCFVDTLMGEVSPSFLFLIGALLVTTYRDLLKEIDNG